MKHPSNKEAILAECHRNIHRLERGNHFDIGAELIKAKACCEHGDWLAWLATGGFFFASEDTAERYMKLAGLAANSARVRNLKVPLRVLYRLVSLDKAFQRPAIEALAKASAKRHMSQAECDPIITRIVMGKAYRRAAELYAPHGKLPDYITEDALQKLADAVPEDRRADVLRLLHEQEREVDGVDVLMALHAAEGGDEESIGEADDEEFTSEADDEQSSGEEAELSPPVVPDDVGEPMPAELAAAFETVARYTRGTTHMVLDDSQAVTLQMVQDFIGSVLEHARGDDPVKRVVDRAEAAARRRIH